MVEPPILPPKIAWIMREYKHLKIFEQKAFILHINDHCEGKFKLEVDEPLAVLAENHL